MTERYVFAYIDDIEKFLKLTGLNAMGYTLECALDIVPNLSYDTLILKVIE